MKDLFAFLYSSEFFSDLSPYGQGHPFQSLRYRLVFELLDELGLFDAPHLRIIESPVASAESLLGFHHADYLETLDRFSRAGSCARADFRFGLGDVENPVFPGCYRWARLACGGTMEAVRQVVDEGVRAAFNIMGGWHHARAARASGFCYLNDAVVAIQHLLNRGMRIAYVDIDAHHGDAVQDAFYNTDRVLTISLHERGEDFYPFSGASRDLGEGAGYGYAVNLPLAPHSDDLIFEQAFTRIVLPLLDSFRPDLLITQMGVDTLRGDPLTRLELTTSAIEKAARQFLATGLPWVALGGGGYDTLNVARSWSLLWGAMTGQSLPERLPPQFLESQAVHGAQSAYLRDAPHLATPEDFCRAQQRLERELLFLERKLLPLHAQPGRTAG